MVFWITALLIAVAVALLLVVVLAQARGRALTGAASDIGVYRDQLSEIDRDLARGVLTEAEAAAVRTEVSRRLLEADRRAGAEGGETSGAFWPATAAIVLCVVAGGWWLYSVVGAPGYRDLPMQARLAAIDEAAATRMSQLEAEELAGANMPQATETDPRFLDLMTKLRETLKERPDDLRGLALLAQNEARLGNFTAARTAQEHLLDVRGDTARPAEILVAIDIMVFGAGGYVSPEAEALIRRLLALEPDNGAGQYYAGLLLAQTGRPDRAFPIWRRLLETGPEGAPWMPVIRAEIAGVASAAGVDYSPPLLGGPDAEAMAAADAMTEEERTDMIRGMVEGLATRLTEDGGPPEDWARLITALGVLGEMDRARAILAEARQLFGISEDATLLLDQAAARAGLSE